MPQLSNDQLIQGLEENKHPEIAKALAEKLDGEDGEDKPRTMNERIREAGGR